LEGKLKKEKKMEVRFNYGYLMSYIKSINAFSPEEVVRMKKEQSFQRVIELKIKEFNEKNMN